MIEDNMDVNKFNQILKDDLLINYTIKMAIIDSHLVT